MVRQRKRGGAGFGVPQPYRLNVGAVAESRQKAGRERMSVANFRVFRSGANGRTSLRAHATAQFTKIVDLTRLIPLASLAAEPCVVNDRSR